MPSPTGVTGRPGRILEARDQIMIERKDQGPVKGKRPPLGVAALC